MAIVRINPPTREAWLAMRQDDVTSTEISALFGVSPYKRPYRLWHDKVHPETREEVKENARMKWGLRLEEAAARGIAEDEGFAIRRFPYYCRDEEARLGASYDYEVLDGQDAVLEVKTVGVDQRATWILEPGREEAPPHIELQLQQQMMLAGKSRGIIGALIGGNEVVVIRREANEKIRDGIRKLAAVFWQQVDTGQEPEVDWHLDAQDIIDLRQDVQDGLVYNGEGNELLDELVAAYREAGAREKAAAGDKRAAKAQILTIIGEAEKVLGLGWSISAGITQKAEHMVSATQYRNFRVNNRKGGKR
jgi:putative phage-type endonuclease